VLSANPHNCNAIANDFLATRAPMPLSGFAAIWDDTISKRETRAAP
jgi:hypothetical protein